MASLDDIIDGLNAGKPVEVPQALSQGGTLKLFLIQEKMQKVQEASERKSADIDSALAAMKAAAGQIKQANAADQATWVNKLGLDPNGLAGRTVNLAAGAVTGFTRDIVGKTAAMPFSFDAFAKDNSLDQNDVEALNRYHAGQATPADMQRLNQQRTVATPLGGEEGSLAGTPTMSVLDIAKQADQSRKMARKINDVTDISSIERQNDKNDLSNTLHGTFADDLKQAKSGEVVQGIANMLLHIGTAAAAHPMGAAQFVAENAPQLGIGALGVAGKIGMTASNVGYAADYYQQGMENFAKENGGAVPSVAERQHIAQWAASLAVAEELGDHVGLHAMTPAKKAAALAGKAVGVEAEDMAKTGLIAGVRSSLLGALEGTIGETATEGYQGYAEDVTARKRAWNDTSDAALGNIYENAAIGGMSGGALSGGVHIAHTALGVNPDQIEAKQDAVKTKATFDEAVKNNTPEVFLDPKDRANYNPSLALGVLFQQNQDPEIEPLARIENVQRAQQIMDDLNSRHAELSDQAKNGTATEAKAAKAQLKRLNLDIDTAQTQMEQIEAEHVKAMAPEDTDALVEQANQPADPVNSGAVDDVINLSMASSQHLSAQQAADLASNNDNGLTDEQRAYLRTFSEARIQENALSNMGKVSNDILTGENKVGGNLGIAQYRSRIGTAIQTGNQERVTQQLAMLSDFADTHADKAAAVAEAWKQGFGTQVIKVGDKWEVKPAGTLSDGDLKKNGGLAVKSEKLVNSIGFEAKALNTARTEMTQAAALRFGNANGVAAQQAPAVQSTAPAVQTQATPATATPLPSATPLSSATQAGPQENILPKETGKDSAHLEPKTPEAVGEKPQVQAKDEHVGKKFPSTPAALAYLRDNKIQKTHTASNTGANEYTIRLKPNDTGDFHAQSKAKDVQAEKIAQAARNLEARAKEKAAKQAEAEQQASAPAESAAVEASPAVEETQATDQHADPLGLDAQRTPKGEERHYQQRNLIADFFSQRAGAEDSSQRPLATVKDFLSKIMADPKSVFDHLPKIGGVQVGPDNITAEQNKALTAFFTTAQDWAAKITANLYKEPNKDFHHTDMMQFLLDEQGNLAENVKTALAYAGTSWIAQQATRSAINTDEDINAILRRNEDDPVTQTQRDVLGLVGSIESVVINSLGRAAVQVLGLKANANAALNLQPDLEAALGAHVMKLLLDEGILKRTILTGEQMRALTQDANTSDTAQFKFLALARDENFALSEQAEGIFQSTIASKGIVDKLFAADPALLQPLAEPAKVTQKTTDTGMETPRAEVAAVEKENAAEHRMHEDMWNVLTDVSTEQALAMAGVKSEEGLHLTRRLGVKAKNAGLVREWTRAVDFFNGLKTAATPFFFEHDIWKQQRVGVMTNMVNPQGSKIHRQMMYRPSWESTIQMNNLDGFLLRVAESFGVKTDKMAKADALAKVNEKLAGDEYQAALAALVDKLNGKTLSAEQSAAIVAGVQAGGENFHSLSGLIAMAKYEQARQAGATEFKTVLTGEVDGVTNGPMLSHLLSGAAATVGNLFDLLNKGGFFQVGSESTQYNLWRAVAGHMDLYETTTGHMMDVVARFTTDGIQSRTGKTILSAQRVGQILPAVYYFTGNLTEDDKVVKAGRDIIKTPLTAMVFGSSVGRAVESMAEKFVEAVYAKIEDISKIEDGTEQEAARVALLTHLQSLGLSVNPKASVQQLLDNALSQSNLAALQKTFKQTIGAAVRSTIETDFKDFLDQRTAFNQTAQTAYKVYNAAYTVVREAYLQELIASGAIATRDAVKDGKPTGKKIVMHDMTGEQKAELERRLAGLKPVMQTAFSQESKQDGAGLVVGKTGQQLSSQQTYTHTIKFGTPFKDNGASSLKVHSNEQTLEGPGVAMAPFSVHSTDAHISLHAGEQVNSLNIHDARATGVNDVPAVAQALNQATWNSMLAYSPASAIAETLLNVVRALPALYERSGPELSAKLTAAINEALVQKDKSGEVTEVMDLQAQVEAAVQMAYQANDMKLQALEQMGHIDQYALEGGHYEVTDADRAAATAARAALTAEISAKDKAALAAVTEKLGTQPVVQTPVAPQGTPAVTSTKELVDFFKAGPVRSITEVANALGKMNLSGFEAKLLAAMTKVLGAKGNAVTVQYVTAQTAAADILEQPKQPSRAWFVSKAGQNVIYVLGAEFSDSGLTKETLLHEMVHAVVARAIETATGDARVLVDGLEELRNKAAEMISQRKLAGLDAAVSSVQELVAYGMTNPRFQEVLKAVQVTEAGLNKSLATKLMDGLSSFINTLVGLVFGKQNESANNGMRALLTNVTGLFKVAQQQGQTASTTTINQSMATNISDLSTSDIYEALAQLGNTQVAPAFDAHLRTLLTKVSDAIHGPFGAFSAQLTSTITDPMSAWANAKVTGAAPFAASSLASGFRFSEQEAFMAEQIEAAVRAVFDSKDASTTAAYREMVRLFDDAREKLKPADFPSQAAYDFVFEVRAGQNNQSDYLSRFAALGLANEQFNGLLGFNTQIRTNQTLAGKTIGEKLAALFDKLLAYINGKLTHTFEGQRADAKLQSLVQTLVDIETKQRMKLAATPMVMTEFVENAFRDVADKARAGLSKAGQSALFQNSKSGIVKLTGEIISRTAQGRMADWADAIQTFRDAQLKQKNGILMGTVNEVRGATPVNAMFYKLMRLTKHLEGQRKELITNTQQFVMESFKDGGKYITKEMKAAVSAVLLRTDVSSLLEHYKIAGVEKLMNDRALLQREVAVHERRLGRFGASANPYMALSKALAYKLATGKITSRATLMNAENIAQLLGTPLAGRVSAQDVKDATPIIDSLVSLYALDHFHEDHKHTQVGAGKPLSKLAEVRNMFKEEAGRADGHGVEFVLRQHRFLQEDSRARLFNTSGALAMKGYLPEVYNPYIKLVVADSRERRDAQGNPIEAEGAALVAQGYSEGHKIQMDSADAQAHDGQRIYTIRDGGMGRYLSGIISMTGMAARGSKLHTGNLNLLSVTGLENLQQMMDVQASQEYKDDMAAIMSGRFDPTSVKDARMAPVVNAQGKVVNYRYMMEEQTKDNLLERDNSFDKLLGNMAGNTFDKVESAAQNRTAIQALHDQYQAEFATSAKNYTRVGPQSTDPEMREIWQMLPESTKQAIREIWGSNNMMVRYDLLDMSFGYRKLSMTDPFGIPPDERGRAEKLYVETLEKLLGRKALLRIHQFEDVWQALVREAKDTMVVKSGVTLLGNFTSNVSELIWFGVPIMDIVKHHRVALKGVMAHRKDSAELARLQMQVETGDLRGQSLASINSRMNQLRDSMARNPVRELIDAGLMPTIVEDVANEKDEYSFKSRLTAKTDALLEKVNPHVLKTAKFLTMAHDTPLYQGMAFATQVSDFLARYTLYQHTISRAENKLDAETAVQLVSDAFVNYDIPSHRGMQYANDMGLVYFSKYYLRIQKVIALLYKQSPGRALMLLTAGHFLDFLPMLTHSAAIHRFGNPFSMGAFESIRSLNEMATVNALMTPFR